MPQAAGLSAPPYRAGHAAAATSSAPPSPSAGHTSGGRPVRPSLSRWAGSAGHAGGGRPAAAGPSAPPSRAGQGTSAKSPTAGLPF